MYDRYLLLPVYSVFSHPSDCWVCLFFWVVLQWLKSLKLFFNFSRVIVWAVSFGVSHSVMEMKWAVLQPLWLRQSGADENLSHRWDNHRGYARNQVHTDTYAIFQFLPLFWCSFSHCLFTWNNKKIAFSQAKKKDLWKDSFLVIITIGIRERKPSHHKMDVKWLHTNKQRKQACKCRMSVHLGELETLNINSYTWANSVCKTEIHFFVPGIICAETLRPASQTWSQSAYLQHQRQLLKEVLQDMDINKPVMKHND